MNTPILPTTLFGGYARPGWYCQARDAVAQGVYGSEDLEELWRDAVTVAVEDQKRAGIDLITDGGLGRLEGTQSIFARLRGLEPVEPSRRLGPQDGRQPRYRIISDITAPAGLGVVEEFLYLSSIAGPDVGVVLPGPLTLAGQVSPGGRYRAPLVVAEHFSLLVRQELLRLAEAGCRRVQVDEPGLASSPAPLPDLVKVINATVHSVRAGLSLLIGFSGAGAGSGVRRGYRRLFPAILDIEVDELGLEFADREMAEAGLWLEHSPEQRLLAGVVETRNRYVETPEEIAARIRLLLRYVPEDRLALGPDGELAGLPRQTAFAKLCNLAAAAGAVRSEIARISPEVSGG
jgi:5-methyltetrahydropteroyltriglutamate--homocysteine methyltransferase